jgi:DNA-binding transcriptional MocR family regulator
VLAAAAEAAALRMRQGGQAAFNLNYGRTAGEVPVLAALAQLLTRQAGGGADATASSALAGRLFLTNGASHALDLLCAVLTQPGDTVLVVRPTYFLASGILRDHRLDVVETPSDDTGLDLLALTALLEGGVRPRFLYIVPTHANPSGRTLCAASRAALVALAGRFSFYIVADEVYQALSWGDAPVPARMSVWDVSNEVPDDEQPFNGEDRPLAARDASDEAALVPRPGALVCSCSSFTKILAPGLRVGWEEVPRAVLARLARRAYVVSGGGVAPFASMVVLEAMLSGGLDAHLARLTSTYAHRCAALCDALRRAQPDAGWSFTQPAGGYFVWVCLPSDVTPSALQEASKARKVAVLDGARCCAVSGPAAPPKTDGVADACRHIRLCFAFLDADELHEAVLRLAAAVADVRGAVSTKSPP